MHPLPFLEFTLQTPPQGVLSLLQWSGQAPGSWLLVRWGLVAYLNGWESHGDWLTFPGFPSPSLLLISTAPGLSSAKEWKEKNTNEACVVMRH